MLDKSENTPITSVGTALAKAVEVKVEKPASEKIIELTKEVEVEKPASEAIIDIKAPEVFTINMPLPDDTSILIGNVAVYGTDLLSKKYLTTVAKILKMDDFERENVVKTIIFSKDSPIDSEGAPIFACYKSTDKIIGINMGHCFAEVERLSRMDEGYMSIRAGIWYNMLLSLFHELYHGLFIATNIEQDIPDLEDTVAEMAEEALTKLAIDWELEPPSMCDEPFFGPRYMELFVREIKEGNDSWCRRHSALHNEANVFYDDRNEEFIQSFREFIRSSCGQEGVHRDVEWNKTPQTIPAVDLEENLEEDLPWERGPVDLAVAEVTNTMMNSRGLTGQGMNEETIAMVAMEREMENEMGNDYNAYIMDEYDLLPPEAAGMNAIQATVVAPAPPPTYVAPATPPVTHASAPASFCTNCRSQLMATMKFCGNCGTAVASGASVVAQPPETVVAQTLPVQTVSSLVFGGPVMAPPNQNPGGGGTYPQTLRTDLPNHNFTPEQIRSMTEQLLHRLYAHIFNKCGYRVMTNPAFDDTQKWAILEPVNVSDIPGMDKYLIATDIHDKATNNTRIRVEITDGRVSGKCTRKTGLPGYTVYLNYNGRELKRILLPQNPWKKDNSGNYSKPAMRAQQGAIIAWIMDGDDNATGKKWRGRLENSAFHWEV